MKMNTLRQFRKDAHGVSVVIGALMLTLIVVTAAVSFAIFTAQKQEELQKQEFAQLLRDSEILRFGGLEQLEFDSNYNVVQNITFSLSSAHTRTSTISTIKFSSDPSSTTGFGYVMNFSIYRVNENINEKWHLRSGGYKMYYTDDSEGTTNESLKIEPNEYIRITIQNITKNISGLSISRNDPISIEVYTILTNDFSESFIPPTPNIEVINEENRLMLDGSNSYCENEGSILQWKWTLKNVNTNNSLPPMYGNTVDANRILTDDTTVQNTSTSSVPWNIRLIIIDNYGMIGIKDINYTHDFRERMTGEESLIIDSIEPTYDEDKLSSINITIKNNHKYNSSIVQIKINQKINSSINNTNMWDIEKYTSDSTRQFNLTKLLTMEEPIQIKIKTDLGNTFEKTFNPPTANFMINFESVKDKDGNITNIPYLDASSSDQVGDAYITKWEWNITSSRDVYIVDYNKNGEFNLSNGDLEFTWDTNNYEEDRFMYAEDNNSLKFSFLDNISDSTRWQYNGSYDQLIQNISLGTINYENSTAYNVTLSTISDVYNLFSGRKVRADLLDSDDSFVISLIVTNNYGLKAKKTISYP